MDKQSKETICLLYYNGDLRPVLIPNDKFGNPVECFTVTYPFGQIALRLEYKTIKFVRYNARIEGKGLSLIRFYEYHPYLCDCSCCDYPTGPDLTLSPEEALRREGLLKDIDYTEESIDTAGNDSPEQGCPLCRAIADSFRFPGAWHGIRSFTCDGCGKAHFVKNPQ